MTTRPTFIAAWALAGCCAVASAQDDSDKPMPLQYDTVAREAPPVTHQGTCALHVAPTEDQRQNKLTIGATFRGPLLTGDASPWVTDGLLHLKDHGFDVRRTEDGSAPAGGLHLKTSITRAYTWQIGFRIFSMVALKAEFSNASGLLQRKYYRAHGDKTNMWGASGEYLTTLNYGLNNLLRVMAEDLTQLCQGRPVEAYTYAGPDPKVAEKPAEKAAEKPPEKAAAKP